MPEAGEPPEIIGAQLRKARESAGLSLSELAAHLPYSRAALGHYETGHRRAGPEVISWYERVCGRFTDPVTAVSILGRADVDRRSFLRNITYSTALSAAALSPLPDIARLATVTDSSRVGMAEVHAVRGVTDAFLRLNEVRGGKTGRSAVAEFLATDVAALLRARFADTEVRRRMFSAAAELAYHAGFEAHDAGADGLAQRYYLSALRLAQESGEPGQDGFVFRILALHANDIGASQHSVALAERAVASARAHLSPENTALFQVALARSHAETGDKAAALAVLRRTEQWITPDRGSELPRWAAIFCPNQATVLHQTARTFLAVGDLPAGERYTHMAATVWDPVTHTRVQSLTLAEAGLIRWRMGQHEDAARVWRTALPTLAGVNSDRATRMLHNIRRAAPEFTVPDTTP